MNNSVSKKRIYHPYWLWEDYKCGFYNNCSGKEKEFFSNKAIEMFNSKELTEKNMNKVINEWFYSCQHNFTNESLNKIAYLGQAACCVYAGVPNTVTMEIWSKLSKEVRNRSDKIAEKVLNNWFKQNKRIQLCLNLD